MKKLLTVFISLILCLSMFLCACGNDDNGNGGKPDDDTQKPGDVTKPDDWDGNEYELELPEGQRQLTIYYNRPAGYANCDIWMWHADALGRGYELHRTAYGAKAVINVPDTITEVGFIIRTGCSAPGGTEWGTASKDGSDNDRFVTLKGERTEIYTKSGDPNSYVSEDGGKTLKLLKFISLADLQSETKLKLTISDGPEDLII